MIKEKDKRIVVTGIGLISPLGKSTTSFWSGLNLGKTAVKRISNFRTHNLTGYPKYSAAVNNFNIARYLGKDRWNCYGRETKFALAASKLALNDGNLKYPIPENQCNKIGIAMGVLFGTIDLCYQYEEDLRLLGPKHVSPMLFANTSPNVTASQISIRFNIRGFNSTFGSTVASSLQSIYMASSMIKDHGYTYAIAGGSQEISNIEFFNLGYQKCLAGLNTTKKGSRGVACPYDAKRNGLIPGEGACVFLLEELSHARKRKAKIYCEIKGYSENNSVAKHSGRIVCSDSKYLHDVMMNAVNDAKIKTDDVDLIMGSANSTVRLDRMEGMAIEKLCSQNACTPYVTSIKGNIGDTFGASGAFNVAAAIGSFKTGKIPPVVNLKNLDPKIRINAIKKSFLKRNVSDIIINSFGFKGINASLIVGKI